MAHYNPEIIQAFADRLYARAALSMVLSTVLGGLIGLVAAPFILQALPVAVVLRCPEWVPAVLLGVIGFFQGVEKGFLLKLQAQTALCQLQIERNTRPGDPGPGE